VNKYNKMYFYVYLITNIINKRQYVGEHISNNLDDNYLGSGVYICRAIKKYGKENFQKQILEEYNSKEEAFIAQEKYIEEFNTLIPNGYNISPTGGIWRSGGRHGEETKEKLRGPNPKKACKGKKNGMYGKGYKVSGEKNGRFGVVYPIEIRKSFGRNQQGENNVFYGKHHSQETIEYLRKVNKEKSLKCPYCNRTIDLRNFKRWHGNNCKLKKGE
jgi:group I intron endonuclease